MSESVHKLCIINTHSAKESGNQMKKADQQLSGKKRTNLSLNSTLLEEAKALGINLSKHAEKGIEEAVKARKRELWLKDNHDAIVSSNNFVEQSGIPLKKYRNF